MAYYYNHNLAYDFDVFDERKRTAASRGNREVGERPAGSYGRAKVNKAPARRASSERRPSEERRAHSARRTSTARRTSSERKPKIKRIKRRKTGIARIVLGVVFGLAAVVMIVSIIHGQVQLTEINQEIIDARAELAEKQSIYTQLEMKVDSAISTSAVEKYAKENLNMSKATNSQKEFISLSEGDKAEVVLTEDKNIFERIWDGIASLWS